MILILLLFFVIIQIQLGSFVLVQIIIWIIVLFLSNFLLRINPYSKELHIIRVISVCIIVFIIWFNYREIPVHTCMLLPLTIDKITYSKDFNSSFFVKDTEEEEEKFYFWDGEEIFNFLKSLRTDYNYEVYMEFFPSDLDMDAPHIMLSKPFLINRHSSTTTIVKFINERLGYMVEKYYLDDIVIQPDIVGPIIKFTYNKIHIM